MGAAVLTTRHMKYLSECPAEMVRRNCSGLSVCDDAFVVVFVILYFRGMNVSVSASSEFSNFILCGRFWGWALVLWEEVGALVEDVRGTGNDGVPMVIGMVEAEDQGSARGEREPDVCLRAAVSVVAAVVRRQRFGWVGGHV